MAHCNPPPPTELSSSPPPPPLHPDTATLFNKALFYLGFYKPPSSTDSASSSQTYQSYRHLQSKSLKNRCPSPYPRRVRQTPFKARSTLSNFNLILQHSLIKNFVKTSPPQRCRQCQLKCAQCKQAALVRAQRAARRTSSLPCAKCTPATFVHTPTPPPPPPAVTPSVNVCDCRSSFCPHQRPVQSSTEDLTCRTSEVSRERLEIFLNDQSVNGDVSFLSPSTISKCSLGNCNGCDHDLMFNFCNQQLLDQLNNPNAEATDFSGLNEPLPFGSCDCNDCSLNPIESTMAAAAATITATLPVPPPFPYETMLSDDTSGSLSGCVKYSGGSSSSPITSTSLSPSLSTRSPPSPSDSGVMLTEQSTGSTTTTVAGAGVVQHRALCTADHFILPTTMTANHEPMLDANFHPQTLESYFHRGSK